MAEELTFHPQKLWDNSSLIKQSLCYKQCKRGKTIFLLLQFYRCSKKRLTLLAAAKDQKIEENFRRKGKINLNIIIFSFSFVVVVVVRPLIRLIMRVCSTSNRTEDNDDDDAVDRKSGSNDRRKIDFGQDILFI